MRSRLAFGGMLACLSLLAASVHAQTTLTGGRTLTMKVKAGFKSTGSINVVKDPELYALANPLCPATSTLRLSSSSQVKAEIALPCANWAIAGGGLRLQGQARGPRAACSASSTKAESSASSSKARVHPTHGAGDVRGGALRIGAASYCGRFTTFKPNEATRLGGKGPTVACQPICGDGIVDPSEACDDGDLQSGDGCDSQLHADRVRQRRRDRRRELRRRQRRGRRRLPTRLHERGLRRRHHRPRRAVRRRQHERAATAAPSTCTARGRRPVLRRRSLHDRRRLRRIDLRRHHDRSPGSTSSTTTTSRRAATSTATSSSRSPRPPAPTSAATRSSRSRGMPAATSPSSPASRPGTPTSAPPSPPARSCPNDTGLGVGFVVVCFTYTSGRHVAAGDCDLVLPAPNTETNLQNGDLLNQTTYTCPDGMLLLDPVGRARRRRQLRRHRAERRQLRTPLPGDALQRRGRPGLQDRRLVREAHAGRARDRRGGVGSLRWLHRRRPLRSHLHGVLRLARAREPGSGSPLPRALLRRRRDLAGRGVRRGRRRQLRRARRHVPHRLHARAAAATASSIPAPAKRCEDDAQCASGETCFGCQCVTGALLGPLDFSVAPGPSGPTPTDDGESSWLSVTPDLQHQQRHARELQSRVRCTSPPASPTPTARPRST